MAETVSKMIETLMNYCNNYFEISAQESSFTVTNGSMEINGALEGQYVRILGSVFNDGIYKYPLAGLQDESFTGIVQLLAIPQAFIELAQRIEEWKKLPDNPPTSITSESFGGYSYTKASNNGSPVSWKDVFKAEISIYRQIPLY